MPRLHGIGAIFLLGLLIIEGCSGKVAIPRLQDASRWVIFAVGDTLWMARLDGSGSRSLHLPGGSPNCQPGTSTFLYMYNTQLFLGDTAGHSENLGIEGSGVTSWRPDGEYFVMLSPAPQVYDSEGHFQYRLQASPEAFEGDSIYPGLPVQWANNEEFLYIGARYSEASPYGVIEDYYLMNAHDHSLIQRLTFHNFSPESLEAYELSPDGTTFLRQPFSGRIALVDVNSGQVHNVTPGPFDAFGHWGGDGKTIVYLHRDSEADSGYLLYRTSLDSTETFKAVAEQRVSLGGGGYSVHAQK